MPGISTLYLEGYFKYKYVQQAREDILHMEKEEAYYLKGNLKKSILLFHLTYRIFCRNVLAQHYNISFIQITRLV